MSSSRPVEQPKVILVPFDQLLPHPLNPNVMSPELKKKLKLHIRSSGRYPPLIVRRLGDGKFQILDGHQRADVLRELGEDAASCVVWNVNDDEALLLLATLNRLEGQDVPGRRAYLIAELESHHALAELARLLPENEAQLESTLRLLDVDIDGLLQRLTEEADKVAAAGPQLFSFAVEPEDVPAVEKAIARAVADLSGTNRRGQALVMLAQKYLEGS
jgi:ParB-like chromosome segregation protein Spo0J